MPRGPRVIPECGTFHITIRGNNKRRVFYKDCELRYFKKLLLKYKNKFKFLLYHYVLMKNHIHFLIEASVKTNISKIMQGLELAYFHYHKTRYSYVGHLWQGRFKSKVIEDEKYLIDSALYIERNPFEAGIVKDLLEYPWSSYRHYAVGEEDSLIDDNPLYDELGMSLVERQAAYRELMQAKITQSEENKKMQLVGS